MVEFNLSKKREKYFKECMAIATTEDEKMLIPAIFAFIGLQDKEFIKMLKEEIYEDDLLGWRNKRVLKHYSEIIDKLAGEKFK